MRGQKRCWEVPRSSTSLLAAGQALNVAPAAMDYETLNDHYMTGKGMCLPHSPLQTSGKMGEYL